MKFIYLTSLLFVIFACTTSKNISHENRTSVKDILNEERVIGIVHLDEICGIIITAQVGSRQVNLLPNNLDEKFKKEGMKLKFFFLNSSMPIPKGCIGDARGDLRDVNAIR
jgi:hypothetical protein